MTAPTQQQTLAAPPVGLASRLAGWLRGFMPLGLSLVAGFMTAFVFAGIGSRLAMRATAVMAGPGMQGVTTEAGATVGQITSGGTMFLIFFGTVAGGLAAGFVHAAVRPWLPARHPTTWFGLLALAVGSTAVIEESNFDFRLFGSPPVNVAMYAVLFVLGGMGVHWAYGRLLPRVGRRSAVILGALAIVLTGWAFVVTGLTGPPSAQAVGELAADPRAVALLLVGVSLVVQAIAARRARVPVTDVEGWMSKRLLAGGRLVALAVAALGAVALVTEVSGILF